MILRATLITALLVTAGIISLLAEASAVPQASPQLQGVRALATLTGHAKSIVAISFSPDGQALATGSEDGTVRLWSVPGGTELNGLADAGRYETVKLFWSPSAKSIAVISIPRNGRRITKIWDVHSGKLTATLANDQDYYLSWSANERLVLTASYERVARLWDARSGMLLASFEQDPPCPERSFLRSLGKTDYCSNLTFVQAYFTPDDLAVITMSAYHSPRVWDVATGKERATLDVGAKKEWQTYRDAILISPDHSSIVKYADNQVFLIDAQTGAVKQTFGDIGAPVAFSPDGQLLLIRVSEPKRLRDDMELRLYDTRTAKLRVVFERLPHGINGHYWSPDGNLIVIVGINRTDTRILDISGHVRARLPYRGCTLDSWFGNGGCEPFLFSADGRVTLKETNPLRLWNTETGELRAVVEAATVPAAFSPTNPHLLVTRAKDKTKAIIWEL